MTSENARPATSRPTLCYLPSGGKMPSLAKGKPNLQAAIEKYGS